MRKRIALCMALLLVLPFAACAAPSPAPSAPSAAAALVPTPLPVLSDGAAPAWQAQNVRDVSVWAAYWDTEDVLVELSAVAGRLRNLCYFEAFFAPDGTLRLPENLPALHEAVEESFPDNLWNSYLTFVNDVREESGAFTQKTTAILSPILADEPSMDAHIEELIAITLDNGFDGVEIDYEALRKDESLWEPFTVFCARLYERTQKEGLGLRVVLEPYAPFSEYAFPYGPSYVVMCYNLHGGHSGEGPKADYAFLHSVIDRASALPSPVEFALATGGYDWTSHGDASQLSQLEAATLYFERGVGACTRDDESGALTFRYEDDEGNKHAVWYADKKTLSSWARLLRARGYDFVSYWRLGGNEVG